MIAGLLSDSHGQAERTRAALGLLRRCGAEAFIHCGDVGGLDVLDALAGLKAWYVWGNTDEHSAADERYAEAIGLEPPARIPRVVTLGDRRIAVFHGHEASFGRWMRLERGGQTEAFAEAARECDYIVHGHTHVAADRRFAGKRIINPGALVRAATYTVATLDLARDELAFWIVDDNNPGSTPRRYTH